MRLRGIALVVATAVAGMALPDGAGAQSAQIAFTAGNNVAVMNADGSGRRLLTNHPAEGSRIEGEGGPRWSPDGGTLAYTRSVRTGRYEDTRSSVFLMRSDGAGQTRLSPPGRADYSAGSWSPDGTRLALSRLEARDDRLVTSIVVINRDGSGERTLVRQRMRRQLESVGDPAWSPDGTRITYTYSRIDRRAYFHPSLFLVNAGGSGRRLLAREAGGGAWSPDGSQIAYSSVRDRNGQECGSDECSYNGEIYVMKADGTGRTRLTRNKGDDQGPDWSADGRRIAFSSNRNFPVDFGGTEVYSIAPDGGCLTWLTNGNASSGAPDWHPTATSSIDAGGCGATERAPLVEVDIARARRVRRFPVYWLGPEHRGLMSSGADVERDRVFFPYDDCARYRASDCPPELQLTTSDVCFEQNALNQGGVVTFLPLRGALALYWGAEGGLTVLAGRSSVTLHLGSGPSGERRSLRELRRFARSLRAIRGPSNTGRLPRPVLPRRFLRQIRRVTALRRRLGSSAAVARRLEIPRQVVRYRLRFARGLRRLGRIRAVNCPRGSERE